MTEELKRTHQRAKKARKMFWKKWQEAFLRGEIRKVAEMMWIVKSPRKPTKRQIQKVREFVYG